MTTQTQNHTDTGTPDSSATTALATVASQINQHHKLACTLAGQAVSHAIEAGKLLLSVKESLPHGGFGDWMANNLDVSDRTARRYMAAALGKPLPIRAIQSDRPPFAIEAPKTDTVSVLKGAATPSQFVQICTGLKSELQKIVEVSGCKTVGELGKLVQVARQNATQKELTEYDASIGELNTFVLTVSNGLLKEKLNRQQANKPVIEDPQTQHKTQSALKKLELRMEENFALCVDTSICLKHILDKKLYLQRCETFDGYCRDVFGFEPEDVAEIHADALLHTLKKKVQQ